jgi:hypothetical protein
LSTLLDQPREERALFNPAFVALLLNKAAKDYASVADKRLPVPLAYLIVPLSLHAPTREALPNSTVSVMPAWVQTQPALLMELPKRVRALRPLVSAAATFGLRHGLLRSEQSGLTAGALRRNRQPFSVTGAATPRPGLPTTDDAAACVDQAAFIGRWFAKQPDPLTALAHWGLRP